MFKTFDILAIHPGHSSDLQIMQSRIMDYDLRIKALESGSESGAAPAKPYQIVDGIGIYNISGPLLSEGNDFTRWLGYADYPTLRNDILAMGDDPDVKEVLLMMRTPGGSVYGVSEVAEAVKRVDKTKKPVISYVPKMMASGGYWVGVPAREIITAPEAAVGSIGVIVTHFSYEKYLEKEGIAVTIIKSDELKAVGGQYKDLTDKEVAHIEEEVATYDKLFKAHVHESRPQVKLHELHGETHIGQKAVEMGLADAVMSFDGVIEHIKSQRASTQNQGSYRMSALNKDIHAEKQGSPKNKESLKTEHSPAGFAEELKEPVETRGVSKAYEAGSQLRGAKDTIQTSYKFDKPGYRMQLTAKELRTALDAGKTLAEIGVTEEEAAKLLEVKEEKNEDLAAAEALVAEAQVQIAALTGKLEEAQAEISSLKEAAAKQPDVNEKFKEIVCGIVDNRRIALGLQKVDISAFSIDTILVEYAAATEAHEKAFKEGGMFTQKEKPVVQTAKDSIQAGHLKAASF